MLNKFACTLIAGLALSPLALADCTGTLTLILESPQAGQTVSAGATINWTIKAAVSADDNDGLALLSVDLIAGPMNLAYFDIPPGDESSISSTMQEFNRSKGIANPGENGASTGFIGVQRGVAGRMNLIQIGGGQNTFGTKSTNNSIGQDVNVNRHVGQGSQPEVILSGSFAAPATEGEYTFLLTNAVANVLQAYEGDPPSAPNHWPCLSVKTVDTTLASFVFTVGGGPNILRGDMNCDNSVDFNDIDPFVAALISQDDYESQYPNCIYMNGDINQDNSVDFNDIDFFVECLINGSCD